MLPFFKKGSSSKHKELASKIALITGLKPKKVSVYLLAFTHTSFSKSEKKEIENNERLEFLGDALLDAIVAEYLFKKFPYKNEGVLTELRSRIVKRDTLNNIANKLGVSELMQMGMGSKPNMSILGNALEALVGAVYLDYGYTKTQTFIEKKIIFPFIDVNELISTTDNYKSLLLEWGDKENRNIVFNIVKEEKHKSYTDFFAEVLVNNKMKGKGKGNSKKRAEQAAAEKACINLKLV